MDTPDRSATSRIVGCSDRAMTTVRSLPKRLPSVADSMPQATSECQRSLLVRFSGEIAPEVGRTPIYP
jgi:hypothetical protein